jgi:hypothetical protein
MLRVLVLTLLGAATAVGASFTNPLGMGYSEWLLPTTNNQWVGSTTQIAADASGALYLLMQCPLTVPTSLTNWTSCVTKLSADGATELWQNVLTFQASTMAVSAAGDVFLIPATQLPNTTLYVVKLGAGGSGVAWQATALVNPASPSPFVPALAADSEGRTYVAGVTGGGATSGWTSVVIRLNAAGSGIDYTISPKCGEFPMQCCHVNLLPGAAMGAETRQSTIFLCNVRLQEDRSTGYAPNTINLRLAAENSTEFSSCSGTSRPKRPNDT